MLSLYLVYLQTLPQTFEETGADGKRIPLLEDLPSVCSTGLLCNRGGRASALDPILQASTRCEKV